MKLSRTTATHISQITPEKKATMIEQELRDYVSEEALAGWCRIEDSDFVMQIVALDTDTLAMRIVCAGRTVSVWGIYTYARAASVLAWAYAGGNWKESEGMK